MPSCNLAETVHNKWLQQSGNCGNDLYVATVDDFVRAFMQVVAYYQYLNGERGGTGLGKEELLLRVAQRTTVRSRDPRALHAALSRMPGAEEFCSQEPHFEGEEVFGSMKRKLDLPLGSKHDSQRLDKVNFSHPRVELRSSKTCSSAQACKDDPPEPSDADIQLPRTEKEATPRVVPKVTHVTTVQETACDET